MKHSGVPELELQQESTAVGTLPVKAVREQIRATYASHPTELPFHGWKHVQFVSVKARLFASELDVDPDLVEIAALVHDLNYLVDVASSATSGGNLRQRILLSAGLSSTIIERVESIIQQAETKRRHEAISPEAMALSDADNAFKALPITPILYASRYVEETGMPLLQLAEKIVAEQVPLADRGIYFYTATAVKEYGRWATANLELWRSVLDAVTDPEVLLLLDDQPK